MTGMMKSHVIWLLFIRETQISGVLRTEICKSNNPAKGGGFNTSQPRLPDGQVCCGISFQSLLWGFIPVIFMLFFSCEKWYNSADVSHVSSLPQFVLDGGDFISMVKQDSGEFEDPGASAWVDSAEVDVYYLSNHVDVTVPGVYTVVYYAENGEGFSSTTKRIVAVTNTDVSGNDLTGTYTGTNWDKVEASVKKIDTAGLYKMDDVLGFPGYPVPGRFVDLGEEQLILLPGEGYFGEYASSVGRYTGRIMSWDVELLTAPYEGIVIPVTWRKEE
jgi:hypothetical protein